MMPGKTVGTTRARMNSATTAGITHLRHARAMDRRFCVLRFCPLRLLPFARAMGLLSSIKAPGKQLAPYWSHLRTITTPPAAIASPASCSVWRFSRSSSRYAKSLNSVLNSAHTRWLCRFCCQPFEQERLDSIAYCRSRRESVNAGGRGALEPPLRNLSEQGRQTRAWAGFGRGLAIGSIQRAGAAGCRVWG